MAYTFLTKRGLRANLPPSAAVGELLFATDTHEVFAGTGDGIVPIVAAGSDVFLMFAQNVAAAVWIVNHNLGKFPSVTIVDSSGHLVFGDVTHNSANSLTVRFSAPFAGTAYLN